MAEPLRIPWPMWKCHYDILGGTRRFGGILAISAMVLIAGYYGFHRLMQPNPAATVAQIAVAVLAGLQGMLLLLGGVGALHKAHTRDADTKMIESHRLTPMTNTAVVVGYLFGPTLQVLALFLLVLIFGSPVAWIARGTIGDWVVGNVVLLSGTLSFWAMAIFGGMRPGKPFNVAGPMIGIGLFANAGLVMVPGLGIMLSAYSSMLGFLMMAGFGGVQNTAGAVLIVPQVIITMYWLTAAAAKYRRPDLPALNGVRGMVLLLLWLTMAFLGIAVFEIVAERTTLVTSGDVSQDIQWSVSLLISMLVAMIPINGAVHCRVLGANGASLRGWADRVRDFWVAVVAAVLIVLLSMGLAQPVWRRILYQNLQLWNSDARPLSTEHAIAWGLTAAAILLALLTFRAVLVIAYSSFRSPKFFAGFFVALAWCVPPLIDLIISESTRDPADDTLTLAWIFGCSPFGTILAVWHNLPAKLIVGVIVQGAIALVLTAVAWRLAPRQSEIKS